MQRSNFEFLKHHDEFLFRLADTAERCFVGDPNTSLIKMRQLGEALAQNIAARVGVEFGKTITQLNLLKELDHTLRLDSNVKDAFHALRKLGNEANHEYISGSHRDALRVLQVGHALAVWYHLIFGGDLAKGFKREPFVKPSDPSDYVRQLEQQIATLERESTDKDLRLQATAELNRIESEKAKAEKQRADEMARESAILAQQVEESEKALQQVAARHEQLNDQQRQSFATLDKQAQDVEIKRIEKSPFEMDEAQTRVLIDEQLNEAGWLADSVHLRYAKGARPQANKNQAIAEWPTATGPADYVLFMGLTPVAVIEAKRGSKSVSSDIEQAKRYAKGLKTNDAFTIETTWGEYKVPLTFATNGRSYIKQLEHLSGIWFLDVRDSTNQSRALSGWYQPSQLKAMLKQDIKQADDELEDMGFDYDLKLRDYQIAAIKSIESAIKRGEQRALVAMATGTGKTKTCIGLIYRLLTASRFRRILFLVDRSALGVQASTDFGEVRMKDLNTFADDFEVMGMEQDKKPKTTPEDSTRVHVATVQGLVKRILYPSDDQVKPGVGEYDCIVVDECHRGYLLDRNLSDTEIEFRDQSDYQSKYRAVIDYFDAFKIGLTATPALHTKDIFGAPIFSYYYAEAVIDGYLVDHLPHKRLHTKLTEEGIKYEVNEPVQVYNVETQQIDLFNTPDELLFEVAEFNRKVIAKNYTKVVAQWLIEKESIDPYSPAKTLVFCVNNDHADDMVAALKQACDKYIGGVEHDAIRKITGSVDKPLEAIRSFKNDTYPNIVVTVDLLTTGIDVPSISNLVFVRRVNSRILYEQMMGRATRRCDEIGKEHFRIYDAVGIYKQLEKVNSMKPVVTNVDMTFKDLEQELTNSSAQSLLELAKKQFLAKLQSKKRHLTDEQARDFETLTGKNPQQFAEYIKAQPVAEVSQWFKTHPGLGDILERKVKARVGKGPVISEHHDEIIKITTGYVDDQKPEDYLESFNQFINANSNRLVAIQTVVQKPWELSRESLKELALELEKNHFREQDLRTAWSEVKNEEITARIIGFIRQAALGEALVPFEQRVDKALASILARQSWKGAQKQWLETIAKQMKANTIVDDAALNEGVFKSQGGIRRAEKLFQQQPITEILADFNQALWQDQQHSA